MSTAPCAVMRMLSASGMAEGSPLPVRTTHSSSMTATDSVQWTGTRSASTSASEMGFAAEDCSSLSNSSNGPFDMKLLFGQLPADAEGVDHDTQNDGSRKIFGEVWSSLSGRRL